MQSRVSMGFQETARLCSLKNVQRYVDLHFSLVCETPLLSMENGWEAVLPQPQFDCRALLFTMSFHFAL